MEISQILARMAPPELEQANNDSKELKATNEVERLSMALSSVKLSKLSEDELKQCLRYVYIVIGIRGHNLPVAEEKEFLHGYIRQHYGNHSAEEVRLAFDMAIQGRLGVDAACFENFSVAYFAKIMNAYRVWSRDQIKKIEENSIYKKPLSRWDKFVIDWRYAGYLFSKINKLPVKV